MSKLRSWIPRIFVSKLKPNVCKVINYKLVIKGINLEIISNIIKKGRSLALPKPIKMLSLILWINKYGTFLHFFFSRHH